MNAAVAPPSDAFEGDELGLLVVFVGGGPGPNGPLPRANESTVIVAPAAIAPPTTSNANPTTSGFIGGRPAALDRPAERRDSPG